MNSTGWSVLVIAASLLVAPGSRALSYRDRFSFSAHGVRSVLSAPQALTADHRYRIIGKVRLLLFWIGNDNVGGARVTWRADEGGRHAIALLVGTEPTRAPRGINKWGYVSEAVHNENADVFGIRSITDAKSLDEAEVRLAQGSGPALFGAMCSSVTATEALAFTATVRVPADVTYRQLGRVLDSVGSSTQWLRHDTARPAGADPGFLTALQSLYAPASRPRNMAPDRLKTFRRECTSTRVPSSTSVSRRVDELIEPELDLRSSAISFEASSRFETAPLDTRRSLI